MVDPRNTRTSGVTMWRAGCGGSRTSGSEGGPEKPTDRKIDRALRSDPYTYIPTGEGWLYMASVLDIGSRRLVGYAMADHMRTELVTDALTAAINTRGGAVTDVIAHADRGTQYTSHEYLTFCANNGLRPSVGRTGVCYDNAVAESFWASLKRECLHTKPTFATRADARRAIMRWVHWYNTGRIHTTLGGIPPVEWEHQYDRTSEAA